MDSFGHHPSCLTQLLLTEKRFCTTRQQYQTKAILPPDAAYGAPKQELEGWSSDGRLALEVASINYTDFISRRVMDLDRVYFGTGPGCAGRFGNFVAFGGSFGSLGFAAFGPRWQRLVVVRGFR